MVASPLLAADFPISYYGLNGATFSCAKNVLAVFRGGEVEVRGFEPLAFSLRTRRSTN
jgi:hypothetical protein